MPMVSALPHVATLSLADAEGHYQTIPFLVELAKQHIANGVSELHLQSSDGSRYNDEQPSDPSALFRLCQALAELGVWVRLPLCQPSEQLDELMPLMESGQVLPYLEIDYVHPSPELLEEGHPATEINTLDQLAYWRDHCPELIVKGHFSIGDDSPNQFELMQDWLLAAKIDHLVVHSRGEATIANLRKHQLEELQQPISANNHYNRVEQELLVLIDEIGEDGAIGRYFGQAYGDGQVVIGGEYDTDPGSFVWVAIEFADHKNLYGVLIEDE